MTKVIRVHKAGGPEVMCIEDVKLPTLQQDEVRLRHTAIGVNLIDTYHRSATEGQYAIARPAVLGVEGAGVVVEVGGKVDGIAVGDHVAYLMAPGAYAEERIIKATQLFRLPTGVSDEVAAAGLLKGMTAHYLLSHIFPVAQGTTMLVHSAAGGVGQILVQLAKQRGAKVIGTVGSEAKVAVARDCGCDDVVVLGNDDLVARARAFTSGKGVDVAYDSVGKDTFEQSLDCIRPLGMIVVYGQSSGPVPPVNINVLAQKGSIFLAKPTLATFIASPELRSELAKSFFASVSEGQVKVNIARRSKLEDVASVHRDLEARKTTGMTILVP